MKKLLMLGALVTVFALVPAVQARDWQGPRDGGRKNFHHNWQHSQRNHGHYQRWGHHNNHPGWHHQPPRWGQYNYHQGWNQGGWQHRPGTWGYYENSWSGYNQPRGRVYSNSRIW